MAAAPLLFGYGYLGSIGVMMPSFLGDRRVRRDVGEPVPVEELERSVADHSHCQADDGPAVEDLVDRGLHLEPIDGGHGSSPFHPAGRTAPVDSRRPEP